MSHDLEGPIDAGRATVIRRAYATGNDDHMIVITNAEAADKLLESGGIGQHGDDAILFRPPTVFEIVTVDGAGNVAFFVYFPRAFVDLVSNVENDDVGLAEIPFDPVAVDERLCCE